MTFIPFIALAGALAVAQAAPATPDADKLFIVHFSTGPSWVAGKPPADQPQFREHGANLKKMRDEGRIALGARFAEKGMIVARFPNIEDARRTIEADPGVRAGTFVFDVAELRPFYDGCLAPAAAAGSALPSAMARVLTDYEAAWQAKDAAALAALFTEDGFVLPSGEPPVRGRADIRSHYTGKGGPLSLRALAHSAEGSTGYIIGAYARAKGEPDIGKFTLTLRKSPDGRWLIVSDMDNGNARR